MNDKKEIILLDAHIVGEIDKRAFYAVLRNDHRFGSPDQLKKLRLI